MLVPCCVFTGRISRCKYCCKRFAWRDIALLRPLTCGTDAFQVDFYACRLCSAEHRAVLATCFGQPRVAHVPSRPL